MLLALSFVFCHLSFTPARAQTDPEYRMEIGAGAGVVTYLGDFNGSLTKGMQPTGGLVAKYKMNPRMAWTAALDYGQLKGSSKNVQTWYPYLTEHPLEFTTQLIALDVRYEYNFWPFGTGREYFGAKHITPFITIGAGLCFAKPDLKGDGLNAESKSPEIAYRDNSQDGKAVAALQIPIGLGVKYKLASRLNLAAEWMMHFTGSDGLDGVKDPYGIKSNGLFKNTDCYSMLRLTLTYDFWERCKTCHNDRD